MANDETSDATPLFRWLELADAQPSVQEIKRHMLALGPMEEGDRVLDVGCGIGMETARLGEPARKESAVK